MSLVELLTSPLMGLFGVLIGGVFQKWLSSKQEQTKRTLDLHAQFHSAEMLSHREDAEALLLPLKKPFLLKDLASPCRPHAIKSVWIVVEFYSRLEITLRHRQADKSLATDLFGQNYIYWYESFLKDSLKKSGWDEHDRLDALADIIREITDKETYDRWVLHAAKELSEQKDRLKAGGGS